jgi:two-component system chemotaxis response regulator CheB
MIKLFVIDDSLFIRKLFSEKLSLNHEIEVIGTAADPIEAEALLQNLNPDILILDIEMPRMDGLTFLSRLMKEKPMKVIVVSSLAIEGGEVALKALELGALEVIAKPGNIYPMEDMIVQLTQKIKAVHTISLKTALKYQLKITGSDSHKKPANKSVIRPTNKIVVIGASTGGTGALQYILERMPDNCPPILIVQHMPKYFTKSFAGRLDSVCKIKVKEAENREIIGPGKALIAPGNQHMELTKNNSVYNVRLLDGPLVFHQRPAVENLFISTAECAGENAIGVILTGMGRDGSTGLLKMRQEGAFTIAQDEESCVVFGMPKEAIQIGAVAKILPLSNIAQAIISEATR